MWKKADSLIMTEEQRRTIEAWIGAKKTPQRIVLRSRICLLAAEGTSHNAIAKRLNTSRPTVLLWINRFQKKGITGLSEDAPGKTSPFYSALHPNEFILAQFNRAMVWRDHTEKDS